MREKQGPEREALMLKIEKATKDRRIKSEERCIIDGIEAQIQIAEKIYLMRQVE